MENYFNYFTEIERFYQTKRRSFTLLCSLDWVLVESWKEQGIPLDFVLQGIDRAFSHARREVTSLAYCAGAVAEICQQQKQVRVEKPDLPDFSTEEVQRYLSQLAADVRRAGFARIADAIDKIEAADLRSVEQQLSALEEKLAAHITVDAEERLLVELRKNVDAELDPFRSSMTTDQMALLEQQLWRRKLLEKLGIPRLSLFYLT